MTAPRRLAALVLHSSLAALAVVAPAAERELPIHRPGACAVAPRPGDTVSLAHAERHLGITYDVAVNRSHRVGHQTLRIGGFRLMLATSVPVRPDEARVAFAACGLDEGIQLRPLLVDSTGEELSYSPHEADLLLTGGRGAWRDWRTCVFAASEAGGAQQDIYESSGGDDNAWPDGSLTLIGFEARLIDPEGDKSTALRKQGTITLGRVVLAPSMLAEHDPVCYADACFSEAGRYRVAIEARASFQGLPIAEDVREIAYDPADPLSRGQRLVLNDQGQRLSWIRMRAVRDGAIATEWERRWERDVAPAATAPATIDPDRAPAIGRMRFNPLANVGGSYADGQALRVTVRVFAGPAPRTATLRWSLAPMAFSKALAEGEERVDFAGKPFRDVVVAVPAGQSGAAFTLQAVLAEDGAQVDRGEYRFGVSPATIPALTSRVGLTRGRAYVKNQPYQRTTYLPPEGQRFPDIDAAVAHFAAMLDQTAAVTPYVTYMIDLAEFEVLPGVYDLDLLDRIHDAAADRGCALTIRFGHSQQNSPYRWHPYTRPRTWDGAAAKGHHYYGAFAVADEEFVAGWLRALRVVHDRYARHPAFQGYYLMQPSGEWNVPDQPWNGTITGYARVDATAFRRWLRETVKLDLAGLNARWGCNFASWDDVLPPAPDFTGGTRPDLRRSWLDFCRFKRSLEEGWFPRVCAEIRGYDRDHVVIVYGGLGDDAGRDVLLEHADYLHNGGNHFLQGEGGLTAAWERGLGWITEPHHPHRWAAYGDPAERGWVLDWSVFVMTAQAGGGGANLHVYYHPSPSLGLVAHQGGHNALDRMQQYRPILGELHGMRLVDVPKQVAVLQDDDTLFCKHRTVFASRREDLRRWFELLKADSVPFESFDAARADRYKLLVLNPLDEVMGGASLETVERLVKAGATVLVSGRAGRFCPDLGTDEYPLLRRLGIAVPTGEYRTQDSAAPATVAGASALFPAGASLPFYSQADNARDLQDPAIGARFFAWPYRWIPRSDYFGRFAQARPGGEVLASFADGGAALSVHAVGMGRAVVCWGTPRINAPELAGFMSRLATWCGVVDPSVGRAIPHMLEGRNQQLNRGYVLLYQERAGSYTVKIPSAGDGEWFIDDMVGQQRFGIHSGAELRERGLNVTFVDGCPPLKVLRLMPSGEIGGDWAKTFRAPSP